MAPWSKKIPHGTEQLNPRATAIEPLELGEPLKPAAVEPTLCSERSHHSERPSCHNWRVAPEQQ